MFWPMKWMMIVFIFCALIVIEWFPTLDVIASGKFVEFRPREYIFLNL